MKTVNVVAAVICDTLTNPTKIFATQRGYGDYKGGWEFPGGKVEVGETPEEALVREIREELDVEIVVGDYIATIEWDYPTFHLSMRCYWGSVATGEFVLKEHDAAKWLVAETLESVEWLPADFTILGQIKKALRNRR